MDGARLKEVLFAIFLAANCFFSLTGEEGALLIHNNDRIRKSFITKLVWFIAIF